MGRFTSLQNNGTAGEMSPRLTRTDLTKYNNGWRLVRNAYPIPQGANTRRPGTRFHSESNLPEAPTRLIPFVASDQAVYMLEFSDECIRVMDKDHTYFPCVAAIAGGDMSVATDWTSISTGTGSASVTGGALAIAGGAAGVGKGTQKVRFCGAGDYTLRVTVTGNTVGVLVGQTEGGSELYNSTQAVGTGDHTFTVPLGESTSIWVTFTNSVNDTRRVTFVDLPTVPSELILPAPYEQHELREISYAQSADVMYLAHGNYAPRTLGHYSQSEWEIQTLEFDDGPYLPENTTKTWLMAASATSGTVTITASGTGNAPFTQDHVGRPIRLRHGTTTLTWGWGRITAYLTPTTVTVEVDPNFPFGATSTTSVWRIGAWSDRLGWPEIVAFQENRICFCATASDPITIWASQSNGYSPTTVLYGPTASDGTVAASMSITISLAQRDIQRILWLSPGPSLAVGTVSAEWLIEAASTSEAWSPTNSKATVQTTRGSQEGTQGIRIETSVLYVQQKGQKMREFTFNFTKNASVSNDMMLLADHIALEGIAEVVYVQDPHSYVVARLNNGELRFLTYVGEEDVGGWSRQIIGGSFEGGNAVVESIAVVPDYDLGYDALWMIVKRTIDEQTVRYIEIMQPPFYQGNIEDAWYLDCAVQTTGTDLTEVTADHLEGESLGVYVDGATQADADCDFGTVGLTTPGDTVLVGFRYSSQLTTIPVDWAAQGRATALGTALGKKQKIAVVDIHLYETGYGLKVGVGTPDDSPDHLDPIETLFLDNPTDTAPPLFKGWVHIPVGGTFNDEPVLYFEVEDPIPFTVLEYSARGSVNEN